MSQELEAKFLAASGQGAGEALRRLQETLAWAGFRIQPEGRRKYRDTYYDTPQQHLYGAGWSYRQREDAAGRRVALQEVTRSRSAVFDRMAVEQPLAGSEAGPDLSRPPAGPVGDRLSNLLPPGEQVAPMFTVRARRAAYRLSHPDHPRGLVEMAFDEAQIEPAPVDRGNGGDAGPAAGDGLGFGELALALKEGDHELLARILAAVDLEPGLLQARLSKFERGLLAAGLPLTRHTRPALPVTRRSRAIDVALGYLKTQLEQMRLFEPYAWESIHPRGVHQMRVATRRARAALRAFEPVLPADEFGRLRPRLRWLAHALGAVRDLDVHLTHLNGYRRVLGSDGAAALDRYAAHLEKSREDAHQRLVDALESDAYVSLLQDYRALLDAGAAGLNGEPLRLDDIAHRLVLPLLHRAWRRGRRIDEGTSDERLHRLRIDIKRLRYQLEFLQGAYADELEAPLAALRKLQNRLGLHQDACVARQQLVDFRRDHAADKPSRQAFKRLVQYERHNAQRHRSRFQRDWARFERASARLVDGLRAPGTRAADPPSR